MTCFPPAFPRPARWLAVAMLTIGLSACGGDNSPPAMPGDVVGKSPLNIPAVAGTAGVVEKLTYRMTGVDGAVRAQNAVVMIPAGDPPDGGWPVIAWGHGTVGIADTCAPSASENLGGYASYLNDVYLANNFAIVAADYEGLGTPGLHPYLHLESEGRSMLQAVNAAVKAYPSLSRQFANVGHSQGGHAALGAAQYASVTPDITLVGTVAIAPTSNVTVQSDFVLNNVINNAAAPLTDRIGAAVARIGYAALIMAGVKAVNPNWDYGAGLGPDGVAAGIEALAIDGCSSEMFAQLLAPVQAAIGADGDVETLIPSSFTDDALVAAYLADLEPGTLALSAPVLLQQGALDTTVLQSSSDALSVTMTNAGSAPQYSVYGAAGHRDILADAAAGVEIVTFLQTQFAAAAP